MEESVINRQSHMQHKICLPGKTSLTTSAAFPTMFFLTSHTSAWRLFCLHGIFLSACLALRVSKGSESSVEWTGIQFPTTENTSFSQITSGVESCWPKENFALMQPTTGCPQENWLVGTVMHTLKQNSTLPEGELIKATVDGAYMTINFCAHPRHHDCPGAPDHFPSGSYCLYMYGRQPHTKITQNCPANFKWSWVAIDDLNVRNRNARTVTSIYIVCSLFLSSICRVYDSNTTRLI
jgi:hypothetical protein